MLEDMLELLNKTFVELDEEKVINIALRCLSFGYTKYDVLDVLNKALVEVGKKYSEKQYTLSDLMMAGIIYEELISMPRFDVSRDIEKHPITGVMVLGTVEGDIHDIGKSVFKNVAVTSGFTVYDLGVDVSAEKFCEAAKEHDADILAMSITLTPSIQSAHDTVELLKASGRRDKLKVKIGGGIVNEAVHNYVGSDGFSNDAMAGIKICLNWMENNGR